jgi:hypothetical protein
MGKEGKKDVKRELVLALMVMMIFISLLVTWTILGAVDGFGSTNSNAVSQQGGEYKIPLGTGRVALSIKLSPDQNNGDT